MLPLATLLFFSAGIAVGRRQLRSPISSSWMALLLLFLLGLKAGQFAEVSRLPEVGGLWFLGTFVSLLAALVAFFFYRIVSKESQTQSAAWACHFGSVSAVTFVACTEFLESKGVAMSSLAPTIMAWMEVPGLILGVYLAERKFDFSVFEKLLKFLPIFVGWGLGLSLQALHLEMPLLKPILTFVLLSYLFVIAWENGPSFSFDFLKTAGGPLAISIFLNLSVGALALASGFVPGNAIWMAVLAGSASYLAAPAVVRGRWPGIDENRPLLAALFVVFPWNLLIGIPMALHWIMYLTDLFN